MKLITNVVYDARILPHFLKHYTHLGITQFYASINTRGNPDIVEQTKELVKEYNFTIHSIRDDNYYIEEIEYKRELIDTYCQEEWFLIADIDEFQIYPAPIPAMIEECIQMDYDYIPGKMIDMHAIDGTFKPLDDVLIYHQYPIRSDFTEKIIQGETRKVCLLRPTVQFSAGHHLAINTEKRHPFIIEVLHYKWTGNVEERIRARVEDVTEVGWEAELYRLFEHLEKHGSILTQS